MFYLGLQKAKVTKVDLVNGDGADTLLGSIGHFMYVDRPHIVEKYNVTDEEANTAIKIRFYHLAQDPTLKKGKGAGHLFVESAKDFSCNPIMAFKSIITKITNASFKSPMENEIAAAISKIIIITSLN